MDNVTRIQSFESSESRINNNISRDMFAMLCNIMR